MTQLPGTQAVLYVSHHLMTTQIRRNTSESGRRWGGNPAQNMKNPAIIGQKPAEVTKNPAEMELNPAEI